MQRSIKLLLLHLVGHLYYSPTLILFNISSFSASFVDFCFGTQAFMLMTNRLTDANIYSTQPSGTLLNVAWLPSPLPMFGVRTLSLHRRLQWRGERDFVPYQSWGLIRESSTQKETELTSLKPKFSGRIIMKRDFMASRMSEGAISSMWQATWLTVEPIFHKRWLEV